MYIVRDVRCGPVATFRTRREAVQDARARARTTCRLQMVWSVAGREITDRVYPKGQQP